MENTTLLNRYIHPLKMEAMKSNIKIKLSACLLKGKKMICKPCCNTERNYYKGVNYGSLHAEANVIFSYYGKNLFFDRGKNKWCLLWNSSKKFSFICDKNKQTNPIRKFKTLL